MLKVGPCLAPLSLQKKIKMTVIFFIAQWFSIALRATAHGDHSHDVYMGPEHLVHYDQVPDNAFKKVGEDQLVGSFQFKNR